MCQTSFPPKCFFFENYAMICVRVFSFRYLDHLDNLDNNQSNAAPCGHDQDFCTDFFRTEPAATIPVTQPGSCHSYYVD